MGRTGKAALAALTVLALVTACSKKDDTATGTGSSTTTTAAGPDSTAGGSKTTGTSAGTTGTTAGSAAKDDTLAQQALVATSDLPPGQWVKGTVVSTSGFGGSDLLKTPSCTQLVSDATAATAPPTGKAAEELTQGADKQITLTNDVALYASASTPTEIGGITGSPGFTACILDAVKSQSASSGSAASQVSNVQATTFDVGVTSGDVGVGFVTGLNLSFDVDTGTGTGATTQAVGKLVFIGAGRGVSTVSLLAVQVPGAGTPVDVTSLDIKPTVKAAAQNLVSVTKAS